MWLVTENEPNDLPAWYDTLQTRSVRCTGDPLSLEPTKCWTVRVKPVANVAARTASAIALGVSGFALAPIGASSAAVAGAPSVVASWMLDGAATGGVVTDASGPHDGHLSSTSTVMRLQPPVGTSSGTSFTFPGWRDATYDAASTRANKWLVSPDASAVIVPETGAGDDSMDPGTGFFRVELSIRADDSRTAVQLLDHDSPNVIQKGRAASAGVPAQQWKVSLLKSLVPVCTFKGDVDPGPTVVIATRRAQGQSGDALRPDVPYRLRCEVDSGVVTLRILDLSIVGASERVVSYGAADYFSVSNDQPVWIGKKPDNTNAGDAFAGSIDNVSITRG